MKKLIVLWALLAGAAAAQDYPAKPVRVIVPYAAGGNADIWARTLAQKLGEAMRQAFVVENKPGANGGLGTDFVAKSAPDGYTLLAVASGPIVVNPVLYAQVPYDPLRDLTPVAQCTLYQYVLVTRADAPYKSIAGPGGRCARSSGRARVRLDRHRRRQPSCGRAVRARHRYALQSHPVQGQRAGARRPAGRPAQLHVRHGDHFGAADPGRQAARLRGVERQAGELAPEVPTMQEAGFAGFDMSQWQGCSPPRARRGRWCSG